MEFSILYWHWILLGFALAALEIFLPSFMMLWFGVAAIAVGGLLFLIPTLSFTAQLFLFTALAIGATVAWFKFIRPLSKDKTQAGLGRESIIGQAGMVLKLPVDGQRGTLRLPAPILGNDEWLFLLKNPEIPLAIGDRVRIIDVSGNSLVVDK